MGAGLGLVVLGQRAFASGGVSTADVAAWLLGLGALVVVARVRPRGSPAVEQPPPAPARPSPGRLALVLAATALTVAVFLAQHARAPTDGHGDIVVLWLLAMGVAVVAAWRPRTEGSGARTDQRDRLALVILLGFAAVVALVRLDSYPWVFNGDEGTFALSAREVLDGQSRNPFGTGIQAHPTLFFHLQAGVMALAGDGVAGARTLSALLGAATVPLAYLVVARGFGRPAGVAAAVLLAAFHVHLFWARDAMNNVASGFFALLVVLLLWRALEHRRAIGFLATGLLLGVGQYFYVGNRLLPAIVALLLVHALWTAPDRGEPRRLAARRLAAGGLLVAAGAAVALAPLAAHYARFPAEFGARIELVSIFATGWYEAQLATGQTGLQVLADQVLHAALAPFATEPAGQYRGAVPFVGWPYAVPAAVGLAVATARLREVRYAVLAIPYWVTVAGYAVTVPPLETNRFVLATPFVCAFAALGVLTLARAARDSVRIPAPLVAGVAATAVGLAAAWSLHLFFGDANQVARYSDGNTQVANRLGYELASHGRRVTVWLAGPPRMWWHGFENLQVIAPNAVGLTREQPWSAVEDPPALDGPTLFVFVPERASEAGVVRRWFPGGMQRTVRDEAGRPLYVEYRVGR